MSPPENPYAVAVNTTGPNDSGDVPLSGNDAGMVNQVMVVGILQIVLGAMEFLLGVGLLIFSLFMSTFFADMKPNEGGKPPPEEFVFWMQGIYGGLGGILMFFALLRIVAGISSFWFRGRILMFVSLIGGLCSALTCYCSPMSIGLAIYGLVVMLNAGVVKAYQLGASGIPPKEIRRRFMLAQLAQMPSRE